MVQEIVNPIVHTKLLYLPLHPQIHSVRQLVIHIAQITLMHFAQLPLKSTHPQRTSTITHSHRRPSQYTPHRNSRYNITNHLPLHISNYTSRTLTRINNSSPSSPPLHYNTSKLLSPPTTHLRPSTTSQTLPSQSNNNASLHGVIHTSPSSTSTTTRTSSSWYPRL